jgi:uncharacterized protein (TIGR02145 family)
MALLIDSGRININRTCNGYYLRWWYNGWHYWYFLPGSVYFDTEGEDYYTLGTQKIAMSSGQIDYGQCQAIRTILNAIDIDIWTDVGWKSTRLERDSIIVYDNKVDGYDIEFVMIMGSRHISDSGYSPVIIIPPVIPPVWTSSCPNGNIVIGTQVWSSCNYDIVYPGSQVYDNDEANRTLYGGLYTWNQIITAGFCPVGWHIPTVAEWDAMLTFIGGAATAGDILKAIGNTYWNPVNDGTDDYLFGARGSGYGSGGGFNALNITGDFWAADAYDASDGYMYRMWNDQDHVTKSQFAKTTFLAVRLIRDTPATVVDTGYGALYNWYVAVKGDWFLPSHDELMEMHAELYHYSVGGFSDVQYWSSTETSATEASAIAMNTGSDWNLFKSNATVNVRSCRSFVSSTVYSLRDTGPRGGLIFIVIDNGNGTFTYYEAAPSDQSTGYIWSNINTAIGAGANSYAIGAGKGNTNAITSQVGFTDGAALLAYNEIGASIAPEGWHVPTYAERDILIAFEGGLDVAGGKLKETGFTHWLDPNTEATNSSGFTALGSGIRIEDGSFIWQMERIYIWCSTFSLIWGADGWHCLYNSNNLGLTQDVYNRGHSIRCLLDGVDPDDPGTVTDIDGNIYPTVKIGTQVWMKENLRTTHYADGTPIPIVTDNAAWAALATAGMCYYNNVP